MLTINKNKRHCYYTKDNDIKCDFTPEQRVHRCYKKKDCKAKRWAYQKKSCRRECRNLHG
uniref:Uncharacterized protein n=1 Tax=Megaviridae environmental sample TaxID=1737588 RepID=A0A5J6VID0_9VIRU|nr:MAG: hypothetical protein [Megaviridae environmental sample]